MNFVRLWNPASDVIPLAYLWGLGIVRFKLDQFAWFVKSFEFSESQANASTWGIQVVPMDAYMCQRETISIGTDRGGHCVVDNIINMNFALAHSEKYDIMGQRI